MWFWCKFPDCPTQCAWVHRTVSDESAQTRLLDEATAANTLQEGTQCAATTRRQAVCNTRWGQFKATPPSPNSLDDSDFFPKQEQSIIIYHLLILWFALSGTPQTESILLLTRTTMIDTAELHKTTWNSKLKDYSVDFLFTQISNGNCAFCLIKTRRIPSHH